MPPSASIFFSSSSIIAAASSSSGKPTIPLPPHPSPALKLTKQEEKEQTLSLFCSDKPQLQKQQRKPWFLTGDSQVKAPTAPWMRGPLLLPTDQLINLSESKKNNKQHEEPEILDHSLTAGVRGGRSRREMLGIIRGIKNLRNYTDDELAPDADVDATSENVNNLVKEAPKFSFELGSVKEERRSRKVPWVAAEEKLVFRREKKVREITEAEQTLPKDLLSKLRSEAMKMKQWVKAKKAGVTSEVLEEIIRTWRKNELAMVKIVEPLRRNMDRAREIIEIKTGGLVVWSKGDTLVVYRGVPYSVTQKGKDLTNRNMNRANCFDVNLDTVKDNSGGPSTKSNNAKEMSVLQKDGASEDIPSKYMDWEMHKSDEPIGESLYEREANRLLDGLGPRFIDWWWRKPLPVDADLLPETIPDFKPPFRLSPPYVRSKLNDDELTYLRMLARPLPTHFALGKNTRLQGLAAAIIKLWEKSVIAKIALKVGIPNTNNQQMALELKRLTGGVLILRNKFFIILYRGKDFLPGGVVAAVFGREKELGDQQVKEEEARKKAAVLLCAFGEVESSSTVGTYFEFQGIEGKNMGPYYPISKEQLQVEAEIEKFEKEIRKQEHQLYILKQKIAKSEEELARLSLLNGPLEKVADQELLTEEERESFRKIGLKMDQCLLLGRRGIYDGVVGSIYQHWKHREIVKVITRQNTLHQVTYTAKLLEILSGGILVAIEKLASSHVIILYRGKNYQPLNSLPQTLLSKREALQRSILIQRRGSLKHFASLREKSIWDLKKRLLIKEEDNLIDTNLKILIILQKHLQQQMALKDFQKSNDLEAVV